MEGTYDELIKWVVQFEFDVKLKYGQHNVESLVNEWDNDTPNKILRAETDDSIIFFDVRLFEKNV
ncbi:MAG: hypothetical protein EOM11_07195 [Erysipelotrichia bacterium]|nr:hypothetical protein [Erysipelotrichia bacterium]